MRLYVAGPMTGYPRYNYPAFYEAQARLETAGFDVLNPADIADEIAGWPQSREWYLRRALRLLLEADGVALLPGWQDSHGARLEAEIAANVGMGTCRLAQWLCREG